MSRTADPDSPTKRKLLDAAERLVLEKGYTATTVDDICESAGLTKGSFFHYFESKDALAKAVVAHTMEKRDRMTADAPYKKLSDPLERAYGIVDFMSHMVGEMFKDPKTRAGCVVGNLVQELAYTHPEIRSECADCLQEFAGELRAALTAAKAKHAPKSQIDPKSLSEHFVAVMEGSFVLSKAQQSPKVIQSGLKHFSKYLRSLFEE